MPTSRRFRACLGILAAGVALGTALATAPPASASSPRNGSSQSLTGLLAPPLPGVASVGTKLLLNGTSHVFAGVNAFELGTWWDVNPGCGSQVDNLDAMFSSLPAHSLVRFWAFQSLAVNKYTHTWDFTALDRVFKAAAAHGDYLIATLSDQAGTCDGDYWHNDAWYKGGYQSLHESDGQGRNITSFSGWVNKVVPRYRDNAGLGMWELVNEPESSNCNAGYIGSACFGHNPCPSDAASALRAFFDTMGGRIHSLDSRHLVANGLIGKGQCGSAGSSYKYVSASKGVDVLTYHDYGDDVQPPLPADLTAAAAAGKSLGKPLITEEAGMSAAPSGSSGCTWTLAQRASRVVANITAQVSAGVAGYLAWDWTPAANTGCSLDIGPSDPLLTALAGLKF
jgi:mannan endo-1,4-beta-mannosidase